MPLDTVAFSRTRPFLFHLTARQNLDRIRRAGAIQSTTVLLGLAGRTDLDRERRAKSAPILIDGEEVLLRDQAPLHAANTALSAEWSFADLVAYLNSHVFFWPGTAAGPIGYGLRHFGRYRNDPCVVLQVPTAEMFEANLSNPPRFCRYNSGSPRCTGGKGSPRGPNTFAPACSFQDVPSRVVEVTFNGHVRIPRESMEVASPADWL